MQKAFSKFGVPFSTVASSLFVSDIESYDPRQVIERPGVAALLPPIHIFHGTKDGMVPCQLSEEFSRTLAEAGCPSVDYTAYEGYTHTQAMLENIMIGNNRLHLDVWACLKKWSKGADDLKEATLGDAPRLCPDWLMVIGLRCKPF